jgi:hypothetical protein
MVNVSKRKISKKFKLGKQVSKNPIGNLNFIDPNSEGIPEAIAVVGEHAVCHVRDRLTQTLGK